MFSSKNTVAQKKCEAAGLAFSVAAGAYIAAALVFASVAAGLDESKKAGAGYFFASFLTAVPALVAAIAATFFITPYGVADFIKIKFHPKFIIPIILIFAGSFFALNRVNDVFVGFLDKFGYKPQVTALPDFSVTNYVLCIFIVCFLPAALEETLFRGIIFGGIKGAGLAAAAFSALAFSLYHMSPAKTVYQFAMGFLFALVALKTSSVLPSAIIHFLNNLAVVSAGYFAPSLFQSETPSPLFVALGFVSLTAGIILLFVFAKKNGKDPKKVDNEPIGGFFKYSAAGFAVCGILWIAGLVG